MKIGISPEEDEVVILLDLAEAEVLRKIVDAVCITIKKDTEKGLFDSDEKNLIMKYTLMVVENLKNGLKISVDATLSNILKALAEGKSKNEEGKDKRENTIEFRDGKEVQNNN